MAQMRISSFTQLTDRWPIDSRPRCASLIDHIQQRQREIEIDAVNTAMLEAVDDMKEGRRELIIDEGDFDDWMN